MTHEDLESLCVDARRDHQGGEGVATLVQSDPGDEIGLASLLFRSGPLLSIRAPPGLVGPFLQDLRVKRGLRGSAKCKVITGSRHSPPMPDEGLPQDNCDRDGAATGPRLQRDLSLLLIPAVLHSDDIGREVDVVSLQRLKLAATREPISHPSRRFQLDADPSARLATIATVEATTIIAGYAAIVATSGLAWQVYAWQHRRIAHVDVQVRYGIAVPLAELVRMISIEASNRGKHVVRVNGVGLDLQGDSGGSYQQVRMLDFAALPGSIESFDAATAFITVTEAERAGFDVFKPITAWVRLATGETMKSAPTRLRSRG